MVQRKKRQSMGRPDPIDIHVGSRVRLRRTILRMSQEKLADQLGITFQQVQKYENGSNRVGASRLYAIAQILAVEVAYFYEGYEGKVVYDTPKIAENMENIDQHLKSRETIDLVKSYYGIADKAVRRKVLDMIKSLSPSDK